jgi:type I restriction enzyme S subunit
MSFKKLKLRDAFVLNYGKSLPERDRKEGEYPVYGSSGITGFHNEPLVSGPGIILGRKGSIGTVYFSSKDFFPIDTVYYVTPAVDEVDLRYSYYLLKSLPLKSLNSDAAVPGLNREIAYSVEIKLPSISAQKSIVEVIANYDDLIENNKRRIALLEESARLLYREWFVHFRFPGHEHVKIIDGLPEGWRKTTVDDVVEVLSGGTPKTTVDAYWNGEIPFFTPKDATEYPYVYSSEKHITEEGLSKCNSKLYPKKTLFITARGTVGKLNLAMVPMAMNQSCYALKSKGELSQEFLFYALKSSISEFKSRAGGAVFDAIVVKTFSKILINIPSLTLLEQFQLYVEAYLKQIENLILMNQKLTQARDILLPRLMNGDLAV